MTPRIYEGVPYYPYRVRFKLADGRRRSWVRWAPNWQYMWESLNRELHDRDVPGNTRITVSGP